MASDKNPEHVHIEEYMRKQFTGAPIYEFLLSDATIISASRGHFTARLAVTKKHINMKGGFHGSVSATIVDWAGGLAIATHDLRPSTGVSLDIHVTYQSSAKEGQEVEIEGLVEKLGGTIGFTRVNIYLVENGLRGRIVASGTHTKFVRV